MPDFETTTGTRFRNKKQAGLTTVAKSKKTGSSDIKAVGSEFCGNRAVF